MQILATQFFIKKIIKLAKRQVIMYNSEYGNNSCERLAKKERTAR